MKAQDTEHTPLSGGKVSSIDLFDWLDAIPIYPKIYWASRDGKLRIAAAGTASANDDSPMQFGWRHFTPASSSEWDGFARSYFFSPQIKIIQKNYVLQQPSDHPHYQVKSIESLPSREQWMHLIAKTVNAIEAKQFEKVVIARRVAIECTSRINALAICRSLTPLNRTIFFIQPTPASAFIGASPEMLYQRNGRAVHCDALAGTRPAHQKEELLASAKDRHEFLIVQKRIMDALSAHCIAPPTATDIGLYDSSSISHLYSLITGNLKDEITDDMLLDALHPTPAVGGYPSDKALAFIEQNEPFSRGLYAAPIGWKGHESADFAVGIRSCLIQENRAYLYAGTGIVTASDPIREWEESEQKLSQWKIFFNE